VSTNVTPREARLARLDVKLERLNVICAEAAEHDADYEPPGIGEELAAMTEELQQMLRAMMDEG
jgi:hypothetical protein